MTMIVVRIGSARRWLRAVLPATWTLLFLIVFCCSLHSGRPGLPLASGQTTDLPADRQLDTHLRRRLNGHVDGQDAALGGLLSRRLKAADTEGDGVAGGDYEYEYVEESDTDLDLYAGGQVGGLDERFGALGKLSHDDIARKDVFSARMQDVLSRREHVGKTSGKIKVKTGKRYLAPRMGDREGLSLGLGSVGDQRHRQSNFIEVTFLTIGMALSAGFGAMPFFFVKELSPTMNGLATAVACGVMFAASFDLIHEGQPYGAMMVILGICVGAMFIRLMQRYLDNLGDVSFGKLHGAKAKRMILVVGIMVRCERVTSRYLSLSIALYFILTPALRFSASQAAHAVGEGCGVGVSFVGEKGFDQGLLTTVAIGIHNIPEGMAKATVLVSQGATPVEALFWSVTTCLPQPLMAIPSFLFVNTFEFLLPVSLGFAAGCMIWMVFAELLPDALETCDAGRVASAATFSAAGLEGFRMLMESLDATHIGNEEGAAFEDTSLNTARPPTSIKLSFGMVLVMVSILTSWTPHATRVAHLTVPVVLGMVSVVMGLLGARPLARDLLLTYTDAPRLHVLAAAGIGMLGIVLLRNVVLDQTHTMLIRRRGKGDGLLGDTNVFPAHGSNGTAPPAVSAMDNHRLPSRVHRGDPNLLSSSPRPTLRALAVILVATSILYGLVCGALLQRVGVDGTRAADGAKSPSLAALYGCIFGIVAGCSSYLWGLDGKPSAFRSTTTSLIISGACLVAHHAASLPGMQRFILPYPRGLLDSLSWVASGALTMTALLTLAVGMTSQPRYTRFGVILACLLVAAWAVC